MADDDRSLSKEEFARWLTPPKALERLAALGNGFAISEIVRRLRGGELKGAAETVSVGPGTYDDPTVIERPILNIWLWARMANDLAHPLSGFWRTGGFEAPTVTATDWRMARALGKNDGPEPFHLIYGVRFDPEGINRILPIPTEQPSAPNLETVHPLVPKGDVGNSEKSPISDMHLKAWHAFYQAIRPSDEQTEEDAIAYVAQCFPDKSVTRTRIRALRGAQKSGPKPKSAK